MATYDYGEIVNALFKEYVRDAGKDNREIIDQVVGIVGTGDTLYTPGYDLTFKGIVEVIDSLRQAKAKMDMPDHDNANENNFFQRLGKLLPRRTSSKSKDIETPSNNHMSEIPPSGFVYQFTSNENGLGKLTLLDRASSNFKSLLDDPNQLFLSFNQ